MHPLKVLFLCTGNSCRSQMAEAVVNDSLPDRWTACSAGTKPAGIVHPLALKALAEVGIEHQGVSKSVDEFQNETFDLVITVCSDAEENCPVWLRPGKKVHIGFPDPAKVQGTDEEKMTAFRQVLADIRSRVVPYLNQFAEKGDQAETGE